VLHTGGLEVHVLNVAVVFAAAAAAVLLGFHHCRGTSSAFFFGSLGKKKEAIA
jgi:hypothetical protein